MQIIRFYVPFFAASTARKSIPVTKRTERMTKTFKLYTKSTIDNSSLYLGGTNSKRIF